MPTPNSLESQISEIVLRATAKVCHGFEPWRIEAIAKPLADAMVDIVVEQGYVEGRDKYRVQVSNYTIFEIWNCIMDEVIKEIPVGHLIEIFSTKQFTRTDRAFYLSGRWRNTLPSKKRSQDAAATINRDRQGEAQDLDY